MYLSGMNYVKPATSDLGTQGLRRRHSPGIIPDPPLRKGRFFYAHFYAYSLRNAFIHSLFLCVYYVISMHTYSFPFMLCLTYRCNTIYCMSTIRETKVLRIVELSTHSRSRRCLFCSSLVTHLTFPGSYPLSLSIRSSVIPGNPNLSSCDTYS